MRVFSQVQAKPAHVDVDGSLGTDAVQSRVAPGEVKQLLAAERPAGIPCERGEAVEFTWLQRQRTAARRCFATTELDGNRTHVHHFVLVDLRRRRARFVVDELRLD